MARTEREASGHTKTVTFCTVHSDRETLLTCIRCERPFCHECMEHTEAGLICHECLGLPPPEIQRKNAARREVLSLTATAAVIALIQLFLNPFSVLAVILGGAAGWLMGGRLRRARGRGLRTAALLVGAGSLLAGTLLAAMVRLSLSVLGDFPALASMDFFSGTIRLVIASAFYLFAGAVAMLWTLARA